MNVGRIGWCVVIVLCAGLLAIHGSAEAVLVTGSLGHDDDVVFVTFTVGAASTVTLRSYSYAGGTSAGGTVIVRGGFDPILSLFNPAGALIGSNDDGAGVGLDLVTGERRDSLLTMALSAGTYTAAISEADNSPGATVGSPFSEAGAGDFTGAFGCAAGKFCDSTGDSRTSSFAFDILVNAANVAEPSSLALLGAGFGLALLRRGWRRLRHTA